MAAGQSRGSSEVTVPMLMGQEHRSEATGREGQDLLGTTG